MLNSHWERHLPKGYWTANSRVHSHEKCHRRSPNCVIMIDRDGLQPPQSRGRKDRAKDQTEAPKGFPEEWRLTREVCRRGSPFQRWHQAPKNSHEERWSDSGKKEDNQPNLNFRWTIMCFNIRISCLIFSAYLYWKLCKWNSDLSGFLRFIWQPYLPWGNSYFLFSLKTALGTTVFDFSPPSSITRSVLTLLVRCNAHSGRLWVLPRRNEGINVGHRRPLGWGRWEEQHLLPPPLRKPWALQRWWRQCARQGPTGEQPDAQGRAPAPAWGQETEISKRKMP